MDKEENVELKQSISSRGYVKGSITRLYLFANSDEIATTTYKELQVKRSRIIKLFDDYEKYCQQILYWKSDDKENIEEVEKKYYTIIGKIDAELQKRQCIKTSSQLTATPVAVKLPPIHIDFFDGKITQYVPFINLFRSMIHNDKSIDSIQKLYYLRSYLKGEPLDLIKSLPLTSESYDKSMQLLTDRYDNRFKIVNEHINHLLDLKVLLKSTASNLREFVSFIRQHLAALSDLEPNVKQWDPILMCILLRKLDAYTARAYQLDRDHKTAASVKEFLIYLEKRAVALENADQGQRQGYIYNSKVAAHATTAETSCLYCKLSHKLFKCPKFQLLPAKERMSFVTDKKLCIVCIGINNNHKGKCRYHFRCSQCKAPHNTILHCDAPLGAPSVTLLSSNTGRETLLPTAKLKVFTSSGMELHLRALLDSGSQLSFVTSKVAQSLGLTADCTDTNVIGITNTKSNIKFCLPLQIHSLKSPFAITVTCHVVDQITCKLPQTKVNLSTLYIPPHIQLADEQFYIPGEIQLLLGADVFFQSLLSVEQLPATCKQSAQADVTQPTFINTRFGHIVGGTLPQEHVSKVSNQVSLKCIQCKNVNETLSQFWQTESVPEVFIEWSSEQELCEQIFKNTVQLINNKFQVELPLKLPLSKICDTLGDSFHFALQRFLNLEKKMYNNPDLFIEYQKFIHEYLSLGHGEYVDIESYQLGKDPVYFLPHHAVINEGSKTTRTRCVFDGSMKTNKKVSLNDLLLNGPIVQRDLFDILLLFRFGNFTFIADIKRMFRNITVLPAHSSLQNILWRDNIDEPIKCIRLNTVTYGLKSSSFLATRCLKELDTKFKNDFPLASFILKNHTYVDDILYAHNDLNTIIEAKSQLRILLSLGSFNTHKWSSNDSRILGDIPPNEQHFDSMELQGGICMKALGLNLVIKDDNFKICSPQPYSCEKVTKQSILSYIGKFYDPMGYVCPIIVIAKAIMQKIWLEKTDWKSSPSEEIIKEWLQFTSRLAAMKPILIDRNIHVSNSDIVQLVGFADAASSTAQGCCLYLRVTDTKDKTKLHLLCAKSRINPIKNKNMTVPRLENAALLLSKLATKVYNTLKLKMKINNVYLFSDSQIVLAWISTEITKLQAYVANRVKLIHQQTADWHWLYTNTKNNPADYISRGVPPHELASCTMWWIGPKFLHDSMYGFDASYKFTHDLPETSHHVLQCTPQRFECTSNLVCSDGQKYIYDKLKYFSNINKIIRVLAYVLRFCNIKIKKAQIRHSYLSSAELQYALMLIIKHEQHVFYNEERKRLLKGNNVQGSLKCLHPFIDIMGLIRVGGRLQHANIPYSQKHPIILPRGSQITNLLIRSEHEKLLHAAPKLLLANLNQKYWIVNGHSQVKKITQKCVTCFRHKASASKQLMGSLPSDRIRSSRIFQKVGLDYCGPVDVKQSRIRRALISKGYICVFVCFVTKAIHLELVSDLSTPAFLACFKRFISRRGLPTDVYSDNASTFKGARNQLDAMYALFNSQNHQSMVHDFSNVKGINFHFIPSYSPVFGGLWEAAVKSTKYHLKRAINKALLTYEELNTVLIQIEAVLNSRPLVPLNATADDYVYLTPGHFLIGTALTAYPEQDISTVNINRLKFWNVCNNIVQGFWKDWHRHYLTVLQSRPKWREDHPNIKVGSLVLLRENSQPLYWPVARVVKIFPGTDNKVRAVEVKTPNGQTHIRSITKISLFPIE